MIKSIKDVQDFKNKALQWASSFDVAGCLDSNNFADQYSCFDVLITIGVKDELITQAGDAFEELETFRQKNPGWITGFLSYDLKNETEKLNKFHAINGTIRTKQARCIFRRYRLFQSGWRF